jgi:PBP1b-binding outer membrane lipoprotein LpoB
MKKIIRNVVLAAVVLAGCAASSYASLATNPQPYPQGVSRG